MTLKIEQWISIIPCTGLDKENKCFSEGKDLFVFNTFDLYKSLCCVGFCGYHSTAERMHYSLHTSTTSHTLNSCAGNHKNFNITQTLLNVKQN